MQNSGYKKPLFILAFDHRSTFSEKMLGIKNSPISREGADKIKDFKEIIYHGFELALKKGVPKEQAGILVDEQFGDKILKDAKSKKYTIALTSEKSGRKTFDFQYDNFPRHIEKYKPTFVKALVRYNPEGAIKDNQNQLQKLEILSDWCHANGYKLLIEPLILATKKQLMEVMQDENLYQKKIRPNLTLRMIEEFRASRIEPDIWKIEGMESRKDYIKTVEKARQNGRKNVSIIILGRGADVKSVDSWLTAGKNVPGIIGFAIGRTIFWEAISSYNNGGKTREETALKIAENYLRFYKIFTEEK